MAIIAKYEAPKQRATRHYAYRLEVMNSAYYLTKYEVGTNNVLETREHISAEAAWNDFHNCIHNNFQYGPGTWEE